MGLMVAGGKEARMRSPFAFWRFLSAVCLLFARRLFRVCLVLVYCSPGIDRIAPAAV
jgi:hypothetical protein